MLPASLTSREIRSESQLIGLSGQMRHINRIMERCSQCNPPALLSATAEVFGPLAFIFGGRDRRRETEVDSLFVFDSRTNHFHTMEKRSPWPSARHRHSSGLIGDHMIIVGGTSGGDSQKLADTWVFNVQTLTWTQGPQGPGARRDPRMAVLSGVGYLFGGSGSSLLNDMWAISLNERQVWGWRKLECTGTIPTPRQAPSLTAFESELILVGGSADRDSCFSFDPVKRKWKRLSDASQALDWHGAAAVGTKLYITGSDSHPKNRMYCYDLRSDEWSDICAMPHDISNQISFSIGTVVFVHGNIKDEFSDHMYFWSDPDFMFRGTPTTTQWERLTTDSVVPVVVVTDDAIITPHAFVQAQNPVSSPALPIEQSAVMPGLDLIKMTAFGYHYILLLRAERFLLINQHSEREPVTIDVRHTILSDGATIVHIDGTLLLARRDSLEVVKSGHIIVNDRCIAHSVNGRSLIVTPESCPPSEPDIFITCEFEGHRVLGFPKARDHRAFIFDGEKFTRLSIHKIGTHVVAATHSPDALFYVIGSGGWVVGRADGVHPVPIDDVPPNLVTLNSGMMVEEMIEKWNKQHMEHSQIIERHLAHLIGLVEKFAQPEGVNDI